MRRLPKSLEIIVHGNVSYVGMQVQRCNNASMSVNWHQFPCRRGQLNYTREHHLIVKACEISNSM